MELPFVIKTVVLTYNNNITISIQAHRDASIQDEVNNLMMGGQSSSVGIHTELRAGRSVDRIPVRGGARFSAHV